MCFTSGSLVLGDILFRLTGSIKLSFEPKRHCTVKFLCLQHHLYMLLSSNVQRFIFSFVCRDLCLEKRIRLFTSYINWYVKE